VQEAAAAAQYAVDGFVDASSPGDWRAAPLQCSPVDSLPCRADEQSLAGDGGGGDGGGGRKKEAEEVVKEIIRYGPIIPHELILARQCHPPVARSEAEDAEYVRRARERARDRAEFPHRYADGEQAGAGDGAPASVGGDRDEWRPVRERFFHSDLGIVMSGLPDGEEGGGGTTSSLAPLDRYPVSPLATAPDEVLMHEAESAARLLRAMERQRVMVGPCCVCRLEVSVCMSVRPPVWLAGCVSIVCVGLSVRRCVGVSVRLSFL